VSFSPLKQMHPSLVLTVYGWQSCIIHIRKTDLVIISPCMCWKFSRIARRMLHSHRAMSICSHELYSVATWPLQPIRERAVAYAGQWLLHACAASPVILAVPYIGSVNRPRAFPYVCNECVKCEPVQPDDHSLGCHLPASQ